MDTVICSCGYDMTSIVEEDFISEEDNLSYDGLDIVGPFIEYCPECAEKFVFNITVHDQETVVHIK